MTKDEINEYLSWFITIPVAPVIANHLGWHGQQLWDDDGVDKYARVGESYDGALKSPPSWYVKARAKPTAKFNSGILKDAWILEQELIDEAVAAGLTYVVAICPFIEKEFDQSTYIAVNEDGTRGAIISTPRTRHRKYLKNAYERENVEYTDAELDADVEAEFRQFTVG